MPNRKLNLLVPDEEIQKTAGVASPDSLTRGYGWLYQQHVIRWTRALTRFPDGWLSKSNTVRCIDI